jgi:hypothetical protein
MKTKDPRLQELRRLVRELLAAREEGRIASAPMDPLVVPDPIEFTLSDAYLDQPRLYPRQGTLLKTVFLRDDLYTEYDHQVLAEWMRGFVRPPRPEPHELSRGWHYEGVCGIPPDTLGRIAVLQKRGRFSFREVVLPIGRRGGKGHLGGLCGAYQLWRILALGDPQAFFEMRPGRVISMSVFGANRQLARANQWLDLVDTIVMAPCFRPFVQRLTRDRLVLATPADLASPGRPWSGSIEIVARETTEIAGRGAASVALFFDEFAHVSASNSAVDSDRLYAAATPALDQFRGYELIFEASSPSQQSGAFFANYQRGLAIDPASEHSLNREIFVAQLPSDGPYLDWPHAHTIPTRPDDTPTLGPAAVPAAYPQITWPTQVMDEELRKLEGDDPVRFRVERLAHWANVEDPYLNPALIERMFAPYGDRVPQRQHAGALGLDYVAHGDPATRHDRFAWVIGHREGPDEHGRYHACIDKLDYWSPADFDDHEIDYLALEEHFITDICNFMPYSVTFDQYSSVPVIQTLQQRINHAQLAKRVSFDQRPHTHTGNLELAEVFRAALALGLVHCPYDRLVDDELRFLQERNGRIDHPDTGPVTTNDVAMSLMVVVYELIGYQNGFALKEALASVQPHGTNVPQPTKR